MKYPMEHRIQRPQPYVPACATDIRKTFAKAKRDMSKPTPPKQDTRGAQ